MVDLTGYSDPLLSGELDNSESNTGSLAETGNDLLGISPKPDYSLEDTLSGAAAVYEKARLAGFTPDEAGATAYATSGKAAQDRETEWEEANWFGEKPFLAMRNTAGWAMEATTDLAKGTVELGQDIAEDPLLAAKAPANIAMASLMNTVDWGKDALLYGVEKATDFYGWATGNEAASNFDPYSGQLETDKYTGREMAEFWSGSIGPDFGSEYAKREGFYDLAGDFVPVGAAYAAGAKSIAKGSFMNKLVNKAGLPSKWSDMIFADNELLKTQASELKRTIGQFAKSGINPTTTLDVVKQATKSARIAGKEAAKETIAGELAVWGSHYKHDELYPEERTWKQDLAFNVGLPALLGVGLPMAAAATRTRQLFNRAADQSTRNLNAMLEDRLIRNGMDVGTLEKQKQQFGDVLGSYGIIGNQAADVAVTENYLIHNLKALKEQELSRLENLGFGNDIASLNDAKRGFDDMILAAEKRNSEALDALVKDVHTTADKDFIKQAMLNAQDKFVNVFSGTNKVTIAPDTQDKLEKVFGERAALGAKLKKKAESKNSRLKPENRVKRMEAWEAFQKEGYQIGDINGNIYSSTTFHMPWSDSKANLDSIQNYQKELRIGGEKATSFKTRVQDDSIVKDDVFDLTSGIDGKINIARKGSAERPLSYTDTAAYNPSWQLAGKQLQWMLKKVGTDKGGYPIYNYNKVIDKLANSPLAVNLNNMDMVQASYLSRLADNIGDSSMFRLYNFNKDHLQMWRQQTAKSLGKENVSLSEVFGEIRTRATQDFLHMRSQERASKASLWQFPKYSDEDLFTEMTGLKLNKDSFDKTGSLEIATRYSKEVGDLFTHKPQKYFIQETNSLGALTDEINNDIFNRLAATREFRNSTLLKSEGTLVGDIAQMVNTKPMFTNGYLSNPNGLAYNTDILGKLGRYVLTQEGRTEGNIVANAAQAFANEMSLATDKLIGNYMKPLVEKTSKWIKNTEATNDFNKFRYQSQSGWNLEDAEPVLLPNGRYGFKLDSGKIEINRDIADRQANLTNGRFTFDEKSLQYYDKELDEAFTLLPDPISGQPLTVNQEVADLLYEAHNLNSKVWSGNSAINQSIGRQSPRFRNYWMPPKDLSNLEVRIVGHESNGNFIPDIYVTGNTKEQAERAARREMAVAGWDKKREYSIRTTKEYGTDKEIIREDINANGFRWADYSDTWQQEMSSLSGTGVRTSLGSTIETGEAAVREWLESVNHNLQLQARRTRMAMFSDEINQARSMLVGKSYGDTGYNELNDYIANLMGTKWKPQDSRSAVYKAFDKLVEQGAQALDDWRNLSKYDRMAEAQRIADGRMRTTSRLFESGDEIKRLYNFNGEIIDQANEAMRMIAKTKPMHSKELIGSFNKMATWGLLMAGNFGYAAMNLVSLPAVMPMMLKGLSRQPGENARMYQARIGAWGKVAKDGKTVFPDMIGAATETLNYYGHNKNEWKSLMADFEEAGMLSTKAGLLAEAFIDPIGSIVSKGGRKVADYVSKFGIKSEELSRAIPMAMGYRLGRKIGLGHFEAMSMGRKFGDKIVGNYVSSNRPALLQDGLGSLLGLFYTYNHNLIQDYVQLSLQGQKAAVATGLATQSFMFGTTSIPGADQIADLFIPLDSGRDLYGALREGGFDDTQARAFIYGFPSAITGLDFSSKGTINPSVPGMATPPLVSLAGNLWDMTTSAIDQLSANTQTNGRTLIEIMQNYLPFTAARSSLALGMGYKTDRQGRLVVDEKSVGPALWYGSNIMSMRTLDETMGRVAGQRYNNYLAHQNELKGLIRRNIQSGLRDNTRDPNEVIHEGVVDYIARGGDPKQIKNFVKTAVVKAYSTNLEQKAKSSSAKKYQTPSDREWAKTLNYLAYAASDGDVVSGNPWD